MPAVPAPVASGPIVPARGHAAPDVVYGEPDYADPAYQAPAWSGTDRDIEATDARYELPAHSRSPRERRRAPGAPFLVVGLIVLGAITLLGGAAVGGMLTSRRDVAGDPTATSTPAASVGAVATATPGPIPSATATPEGSGEPGETPRFFFEDGFTVAAEPCLVQPTQPSCPAPGAVVPEGNPTVWILVVFESGKGGDLIGVEAVGPDGVPIGDASWPVPGATGSGPTNGHAYFGFPVAGLDNGEYEVTVTRNREPADVITFRIDG